MLATAVGLVISLYGLLLVSVFYIFYILRKIKTIGFLRTVKSKTTWTIIVLIAIGSSLLTFFITSDSIPRSGDQLFEVYVLKPIPKSVEVLDSFDGGVDFYPDECLHFKISSADFQLILASREWKVVSDDTFARIICSDSTKSPWKLAFPPPSFRDNVIIYTFVPRERDYEVIFTNPEMNEVYYEYYDGNMP